MRRLPPLEQITAFLAVAEELSFRGAAERIGVDQSALSRRIKDLEERIGFRLLTRTTHAVRLTDAGRHYYESNHRLVGEFGAAIDAAGRVASGAAGALRVAYMTFAAVEALPVAVKAHRTRYPDARIELLYQRTQQQKLSLARGEIDLALMLGPFEHSDFETREVARERLVAIMAAGHGLSGRSGVALADVASAAMVLGNDQQWDHYRELLIGAMAAKGLEPRVVMEAPSLFGILGLVRAGVGITLVPDVMTRFCPAGLVTVPVCDIESPISTLAVWRKPADAKVSAFVDLLPRSRPAGN